MSPHIATSPEKSVSTDTDGIRKNANNSHVGFLQLLWQRIKRQNEWETVFIWTGRNYKVYADIGITHRNMQRYVTILYHDSGSSYVRKGCLLYTSDAADDTP